MPIKLTPVWPGYFADPAVLKVGSDYYAFGTDGPDRTTLGTTGKDVPCLFSRDLVEWSFLGGALQPPKGFEAAAFWAPEAFEVGGQYLLYYSAGGNQGEGHTIRVAKSVKPEGPYEDFDCVLFPDEPFTIDAHPFRDPRTGKLYLFFCKDFFDEPAGTGIAVVELDSSGTAAISEIRPLLRAQADWQVFETNRVWYGQMWPKWHTVEGPFVVYYLDRYWLFYSGGNWQSLGYGLGCAVSDSVLGPYVDPYVADGADVLRSIPGVLNGPGHNSIAFDREGKPHLVFHAWNDERTLRQMYVLPLDWGQSRPRVVLQ
jgi:beta-xylosidase